MSAGAPFGRGFWRSLLAMLLAGGWACAQAEPKSSAASLFTLESLGGAAHVLKAADYNTNIGLIQTPAGVILIDPSPKRENLASLQQLVQQRFSPAAVYILNTHNHEDHTGGNEFFVAQGAGLLTPPLALETVRSLTLRSHSATDHVYFDPAGHWMFVGDLYDGSWHPTFYAGGVAGFTEAMLAILALGDERTWIIPGHGKPVLKPTLRVYLLDTLRWVARVRLLRLQGLSAQQMKQDAELLGLLQRFNTEGRAGFLPDAALQRFIERTLAVIERDRALGSPAYPPLPAKAPAP
ncbi:MBL fold metallo-hydrolase [Paucibacter sp. XJ19-41]|uniref:MBL fold metallo-hydrolase n=1 Tax=Paucibacter sp. XJ19-41 TaxID=2927824 RepID=UPI0023490704|nr:MBL fold metallo-hydrolase [Paucibacter sp. XJ19-41]MDC6166806.1 MBL fold metallo-hydrolase [Paucibacter sp. XJ19-41]